MQLYLQTLPGSDLKVRSEKSHCFAWILISEWMVAFIIVGEFPPSLQIPASIPRLWVHEYHLMILHRLSAICFLFIFINALHLDNRILRFSYDSAPHRNITLPNWSESTCTSTCETGYYNIMASSSQSSLCDCSAFCAQGQCPSSIKASLIVGGSESSETVSNLQSSKSLYAFLLLLLINVVVSDRNELTVSTESPVTISP